MVEDTLPRLFRSACEMRGGTRAAMRKKRYGLWERHTWRDCYEAVRLLSLGLVSLGLRSGDVVGLVGETDPEWYWAYCAIQATGGVVMVLPPRLAASAVQPMLEKSRCKVVVARDQEQVDKLVETRESLPALKTVIYWEPKGLHGYDFPGLVSWEGVASAGSRYGEAYPGAFEDGIDRIAGNDIAALCHVPRDDGTPRLVAKSHRVLMEEIRVALQVNPVREHDDYFSSWALASSAETCLAVGRHVSTGCTVNFAESPESTRDDMREISPQAVFAGPRYWEDRVAVVRSKIAESHFLGRFVFRLFLPIGHMVAELRRRGEKPTLLWRALHCAGGWLVFKAVRDRVGLARVRCAVVCDGSVSTETTRYIGALGVDLRG